MLLTAGTSGIGFERAKRLIASRNTVIVTRGDKQMLEEAKCSLPGVQRCRQAGGCRISAPTGVESSRHAAPVQDRRCHANIAMNQARSLKDFTRELDINLNGLVQLGQTPAVRAQGEDG
jgi:NAD(P)-dependent dehydrogenase (short-subunit alcohol dehydrogenase family)